MLKSFADHALRGCILKLQLSGQSPIGRHFGRRSFSTFQPSAHGVVGQLRPVPDQCPVGLTVRDRARPVYRKLDDDRCAIFVLVERSDALGEFHRQHGEDFDAGIDRGCLAPGMAVDDRAGVNARVHIGHADQHANTPIGQLLGPLDLIQILRGIIVDRRPEQAAQIFGSLRRGQLGVSLNCAQFAVGSGRKIGLKTVLDHRGMGRGDKIEVKRMAGRHEDTAPSNRRASLPRHLRWGQSLAIRSHELLCAYPLILHLRGGPIARSSLARTSLRLPIDSLPSPRMEQALVRGTTHP